MRQQVSSVLGALIFSADGKRKQPGDDLGNDTDVGLVRIATVALSAPVGSFCELPLRSMYRHLRQQGLDPVAYRQTSMVDEHRSPPEVQVLYTFYGPMHPRQ